MMRLSTLWKIDATIDADGRSPVAEHILERWAHDEGSVRFARASANVVYRFVHRDTRQFLRFALSTERSRTAIAAEVALLDWLAGAGVPVARPLRSRTGTLVETVATDLGTVHAVVFAGLEGVHLAIDALDDMHFHAWGAALGQLHAAMPRYPGATSPARGDWRDHLAFIRAHIPPGEPAVRREADHIAAVLGTLPVERDRFGLIHFDFELDNLYWQDRTIAMLDFDDCAHYWYAADIAFALRDLFAAGADLGHPSFRTFVRGYRAQHPLDDDLLARVPLFFRLANLLQYARLVRAVDLPSQPAHPDWLQRLHTKLRSRVEAYPGSLAG